MALFGVQRRDPRGVAATAIPRAFNSASSAAASRVLILPPSRRRLLLRFLHGRGSIVPIVPHRPPGHIRLTYRGFLGDDLLLGIVPLRRWIIPLLVEGRLDEVEAIPATPLVGV